MKQVPKIIHWALTHQCNLSCSFCFRNHSEDLPENEMFKILDILLNSEIEKIIFTGGEPLNCPHLEKLLKHSFGKKQTSIHSNGVDTEELKRLSKYTNRLSLSLDGHSKEMNAKMRGADNFMDITLDLINHVKKSASPKDFVIQTIVSKQNLNSIPLMPKLIKNLKPFFWSLFEYRAVGMCKNNYLQHQLAPGEFNNLINQLKPQFKNDKLKSKSDLESKNYPLFLITPNGDVITNGVQDNILVGSILIDSIESLWNKITSINPITDNFQKDINMVTNFDCG